MTKKQHKNNQKHVKKTLVSSVRSVPEEVFGAVLHKNAASVSLRSDAQKEMRERLATYMEYRPLRAPEKEIHTIYTFQSIQRTLRSYTAQWTTVGTRHLSGAALVAILLVTSTAGASFAADSALPGEMLYPMKVTVNEGMAGIFVRTPEARATWESSRATRRIEEASKLVRAGKLGEAERNEVVALLEKHTEAALAEVATLEGSDPLRAAAVSNKMAHALHSNETALAQIATETADETDDATAKAVLKEVQKDAHQAEAAAQRADAVVRVALAAEGEDATETLEKQNKMTSDSDKLNLSKGSWYSLIPISQIEIFNLSFS